MRFGEFQSKKVRIYPTGEFDPVQIAREIASYGASGMNSENGDTRMQDDNDHPFFVVDICALLSRYDEWMNKLPEVHPHYAVKCNNDAVLLGSLAALGANFDCASRGEIDQVLELVGGNPERILYANPCKTRSYVEHAARVGVRRMVFDSWEELEKIQQHYPRSSSNDATTNGSDNSWDGPQLLLRIAVSDPSAQCQLGVKFGCDPVGDLPRRLLARAKELGLAVVGISFHVGSGCNDPSAYEEAIAHAGRLFKVGAEELGHEMRVLDIGGGFPGSDDVGGICFGKIVSVIQRAIKEHFSPSAFYPDDVEFIAEPGRFFGQSPFSLCVNVIAATQVPASRILDVKFSPQQNKPSCHPEPRPSMAMKMNGSGGNGVNDTSNKVEEEAKGYMYYVNDGVYGSFNCILFDHFQPRGQPLFPASLSSPFHHADRVVLKELVEKEDSTTTTINTKIKQEHQQQQHPIYPTTVWGPTCDGLDCVEERAWMRRLRVGSDWLHYPNMGAYTSVAASNFNGFEKPQIHYVVDERGWARINAVTVKK